MRLIGLFQAAKILQVSPQTLRNWITERLVIPATRWTSLGGAVTWALDERDVIALKAKKIKTHTEFGITDEKETEHI